MFPKGPRFEPLKASAVPGPNAYNVNADSNLDAYKRGAFLEKADRFNKDKDSNVPGPGAYDADQHTKPTKSKPTAQLSDRYAILQRKVEDLERVHNEGKKSHQTEVERLKSELARYQKLNYEQNERIDKQKKQIDTLDARIQDLKKAATTDQTEIKDLKAKLRQSEHERTQMASKQVEASELKKALQSLDSKRRDEFKEKDKRIMELEKSLAAAQRRKELVETKAQEMKEKDVQERDSVKATITHLEASLAAAQAEARDSKSALSSLQEETDKKEEAFLTRLQQHQRLLAQVAQEYARLASASVSKAVYDGVKNRLFTSRLQILRLERKLANTEDQVEALASLIRHTKDENKLLRTELREAEEELVTRVHALEPPNFRASEEGTSLRSILSVHDDIAQERVLAQTIDMEISKTYADLYRLWFEDLLSTYSLAQQQAQEDRQVTDNQSKELTDALASQKAIAAQLESMKSEHSTLENQLQSTVEDLNDLRVSSQSLTNQLAQMEGKMENSVRTHATQLKAEQDKLQRLSIAVQQARSIEDALRLENGQLAVELADAARYQEAYYALSDEVASLVARSQLAEEETKRLSKFNAEILSHQNPAQRIMYVDRIRRELAETKQKLLMTTRERDDKALENNDLQHELDMYKSVNVPIDQKPRTNITRIGRPPLVILNHGLDTANDTQLHSDTQQKTVPLPRVHDMETIPGEMTVDEIM